MSSKLDYLKKYGIPGGEDGDRKKRRRKKSPGSQSGKESAKTGSGLRIIDDEADMMTLDRRKVDRAWEEEETEEEKPAVVLDDPDADKVVPSGSWSTVGSSNTKTTVNGYDNSPRRRRRHDSSDEDASPPRRNRRNEGGRDTEGAEDASPPRRQRARASSPVDASPPRRARGSRDYGERNNVTGRRGSGERGNEKGTSRFEEDSSPPRRRGSDKDRRNGDVGRGDGSGRLERSLDRSRSDASPLRTRRRMRHDSSDEEGGPVVGGRDMSPPRRKRGVRDEGSNGDASPPRLKRPASRSEEGERDGAGRRNASSEKRTRNGSSTGGGGAGDRVKTSSGYYAGLQSGKDFKVVEQQMKRKHDAEMQGADKASSGHGAQTVYRDKKGRKLDMLNEFMKQQDARAGKEVEEEKEQFEWGRGKVQKEKEEQWKEEIENIAAEPFARTVDDSRLEDARKAEIRADDPMAAYMAKKKVKERAKSGKPAKPEYKGPAAKPNRFGIRPGYRWDGNDRGNGWEAKIVAKGVDNNYKAELAYKWATADM